MTEQEWLASADSDQMLAYLLFSGKASDRKQRLYTVASYRRVWHLFTDERSHAAVEATVYSLCLRSLALLLKSR